MKNTNILGICLIIWGLSSCTDLLDLNPKDSLSDAIFWKKSTDLEVYVNTLYNSIEGARDNSGADGWDNQLSLARNTWYWNDAIVPSSGGGWGYGDWAGIRSCNYFLSRYSVVPGDNSVYVGEVRFFRAMFYFDKLTTFGEVPFYNIDLTTADVDLLYKGRDSRTLVVDSILADLDYAISVLPDKKNAIKGRLHKDVASSLASRIALFEGTWRFYRNDITGNKYLEKTVEYCEKVMSNGYSIWKGADNPNDNYYKLFLQEDMSNNQEVIFAKIYDRDVNLKHGTTRTLAQSTNGLSRDFAMSYLCLDGLPVSLSIYYQGDDSIPQEMSGRDPRMQQTIDNANRVFTSADDDSRPIYNPLPLQNSVSGYLFIKFHSPYFRDYDALNSTIDYPTFRYAEVLLNFAEAKSILGVLTNTDLDRSINLLRDRVQMPKMTLENVNFEDPNFYNCGYSIPNIVREIRRERRVEMIGEGFRGNDIKRWNAGKLMENPLIMLGMKVNKEMRDRFDIANGGAGTYTRKTNTNDLLVCYEQLPQLIWSDRLYLAPLPKDQLSINPNLTQNQGW